VWWTATALRDLRADKPIRPQYAQTLVEVDANGLYAWLRDFGASFGWRQRATVDELQQAANDGQVAVICARLSTPGHISVVVPESASPQLAQRTGRTVTMPLQSQAGRRNFCFSCAPGRWWEGTQFAAFGFWTHP
jgi:hypothetical protein